MYIYKATNKINNKVYIGLTRKTLLERWKGHVGDCNQLTTHFSRAIQKYGEDSFILEIIDTAVSLQELSDKEIYWIKFYDSTNYERGYNILPGGITFTSDSSKFWWETLSASEREKYGLNMSNLKQGSTSRPRNNKSSNFIGVWRRKSKFVESWQCGLTFNKKRYSKSLPTEEEAAICYDKLATYFYGENAKTNFSTKYTKEEVEYFFLNEYLKRVEIRGSKYPKKYKYVTYCSRDKSWVAIWKLKGKIIFRIYAKTEDEAYQAQQNKLIELGIKTI